jgi:hypothetical protein
MVVNCIINELASAKSDAVRTRLAESIHTEGPMLDLAVGQDYLVQAIELRDGGVWFFIHTVKASCFPYPYPAEYFAIVDGTISSLWSAKFADGPDGATLKRLSFPEWANDDSFYEKLIGEDVNCLALYQQRMII